MVRMRSDIRPLCDKDRSPMAARQVRVEMGLPGDGGTKTVFCCLKEDCQRRYDIIQGYHTTTAGQIEHDTEALRCPEDQGAMFLGSASQGVIVWMCSQLECGYTESTAGEVDAAGPPSSGP